jgi:PAS domain S-box-containing protein
MTGVSRHVDEWLFESSPHGMALVDPDGRPLRCNRALERFLGYSEAELRELSFRDLTHPEDVELDWGLYAQLTSGKRQHYQIDKRYLHKSGKVVWGRLTVSVIPGEVPQVLGIVKDLSASRSQHDRQARLTWQLRERAKELSGLHELAQLVRQRSLGTLELLRGVVERVPPAFQFPERTAARVKVGALVQASETFVESPCRLAVVTELAGGYSLELTVVYWGKTPDPEREFLPEERTFLESAAELLAGALDRRLKG